MYDDNRGIRSIAEFRKECGQAYPEMSREQLTNELDRLAARVKVLEEVLSALTEISGDPAVILSAVEPGKWRVADIIERVAPMPRKAVYNAIGYLVRIGRAPRLRYGVVQIAAARALQPVEAER